jgi:hypothetical protein
MRAFLSYDLGEDPVVSRCTGFAETVATGCDRLHEPAEALLRHGVLTRSWSMIQFGTNVLPPSKENDCSQ